MKLALGQQGLQGGWGHLILRLLDTQVPLEATKELGLELGPSGLDLAREPKGKEGTEELWLVPTGTSVLGLFGCSAWLGRDRVWKSRKVTCGRLDIALSLEGDLLHCSSMVDPDESR